jgi:photosystem II stability/assembly factor-like uncharacterized protein
MSIVNWLTTAHWTAIGPSPVESPTLSGGTSIGRIEAAAADPTNVDVVYACGSNGGVWKTGTWEWDPPTWLGLTDDQPSLNVNGYHPIVVHPANDKLVLALVSGTGAGILKTTNAFVFTQIDNAEFEGAQLGAIAVHPTDLNTMYVSVWAGGPGGGVYKTTDGGLNWKNTTASFHAGMASDVVMAKWDPQTLYCGLVRNGNSGVASGGAYRSTDGGATWKLMPGLTSGASLGATIRLESSNTKGHVYVTLFALDKKSNPVVQRSRTTDGGNTWKALAASPGNPETRSWHVLLAVHPDNADHVFVNDAYALYESTNAGATWTSMEKLGDDWVNMTFDAKHDAVVTSDQGIHRYEFGPKKWTVKEGNLQVTQFYDIALDPENPDLIYGIGQDQRAPMKFSGTIDWEYMLHGGGETGRVIVDPGNSKRLYVSNPLDPVANFVRRTTDGGQNWATIFTDSAFAGQDYGLAYNTQKSFVIDPTNASRLLLATNKVFETKNATAATPTWKPISGVLSPAPTVGGQYIRALAIAPSNGKIVYASTNDGHVWLTEDDGAHWKQMDAGLFGNGSVVDMRVDPANPHHVFAITNAGGGSNVWQLQPASLTWANVSGNFPANLTASAIFVDFQYAIPPLYVGADRNIYHSIDLGNSWSVFSVDMPNTSISDLEFDPKHNMLIAGTTGRGAFGILTTPSKISGIVFEDPDGDGVYGAADKGMAGVSVFLDVNGNGKRDSFEYHTTTGKDGRFVFDKVPPGRYTVCQAPLLGYTQTTAPFKPVTVNGSDIENRYFGNKPFIIKQFPPGPLHVADQVLLPGRVAGEALAGPDEHAIATAPKQDA